jgi:hypothetical protein
MQNRLSSGKQWAASLAALALLCVPVLSDAQQAAPRPAGRQMTPEALDKMVPKHPGYLGALAPDNLKKARPKAPFDLTGTWFIDLSEGFDKFKYGPPYPEFLPDAKKALEEGTATRARGESYRDSIGQCYPPGMPMMLTRVWSVAWIQLPTAIYVISGFDNGVRFIYLDGRKFTDPDIAIPTYNGESIGHWEGDTLVVKSKYFETDNHWIDTGLPISDEFEITERITLINGGKTLQTEFIMTDPQNWKGEWRNTKRWNRQDYSDINEVHCLANLNEHLPSTEKGKAALTNSGSK